MKRWVESSLIVFVAAILSISFDILHAESATPDFADLDSLVHDYWRETLRDPFSTIRKEIENGEVSLDGSSEKAFVGSLLDVLGIPVSTQMLVYSTTSLQLRLISPRNPRALYFGDDIYVGYVPGGKIEIVSIEPELGGIFYIFEIPSGNTRPVVERSANCMNCHSGEDTREVPGVVIKSVIPGPSGGSLDSFRRGRTGHEIPYSDRFGGWYVTGAEGFGAHWGNKTGRFRDGKIVTANLVPEDRFDWDTFPVPTSDLLAHLLHEHQAGFVNRVAELHYRWRSRPEVATPELREEWRSLVDELVRYLLFAREPEFPAGGIEGDPGLKSSFLSRREATPSGRSLRDFDLRTRLFRHRCSYMIYRPQFLALPDALKKEIYGRLSMALDQKAPHPDFRYLPDNEMEAIREILQETHPDLAVWPEPIE